MKVIIAGSRDITEYDPVVSAFQEWPYEEVTMVISGGARGVDTLAKQIADEWELPFTVFHPCWKKNGVKDKSAGHRRNRNMGDYADGLIAVWDGESPGTKGMIDYMESLNKPVFVWKV